MKNINRLIVRYVLEIIVVIVLVGISFPVWEMLDKSDSSKIAKSYANMDYLYLDVDRYISADEFEDIIAVKNDTNTKRGYELVIKIEKNLVDEKTSVIINDQVESLKELRTKEDNNFEYYVIAKGSVVAGQSKFNVKILNSDIEYENIEYEIIENHEI